MSDLSDYLYDVRDLLLTRFNKVREVNLIKHPFGTDIHIILNNEFRVTINYFPDHEYYLSLRLRFFEDLNNTISWYNDRLNDFDNNNLQDLALWLTDSNDTHRQFIERECKRRLEKGS